MRQRAGISRRRASRYGSTRWRNLANELTVDLQASLPEVRLGLTRAGVTGVQKAIRIRHEGHEKTFSAEISCTVDLDPAQKGVHMSRFPEIFGEAVDQVVIGEAFLVETLAEHIATHIVERQHALRAEVRIEAQYPLERRTPVTGLPTQEIATLIGIAAASPERVRRVVGVEASGINACPCAQGLVRGAAAERLLEAGFADGDVERILELVPLATHNQRGRGTLLVGTESRVNAEHLVDIVESSMSSPVYELLKRPDELFVVEHAHLQPRFVEDSVRFALSETCGATRDLDDADFLFSRQVNLETIHRHDVLAERSSTVGELRSDSRARRRRRPPSCATGSALLREDRAGDDRIGRCRACRAGAFPCRRRSSARTSTPSSAARAARAARRRGPSCRTPGCSAIRPLPATERRSGIAQRPEDGRRRRGLRQLQRRSPCCPCTSRSSG